MLIPMFITVKYSVTKTEILKLEGASQSPGGMLLCPTSSISDSVGWGMA